MNDKYIKVSTQTFIIHSNLYDINLQDVSKQLALNDDINIFPRIVNISYKNEDRGLVFTTKKKKLIGKNFLNCISLTVKINQDKNINVKIFNNGVFQLTGCKSYQHAKDTFLNVWENIDKLNICTFVKNTKFNETHLEAYVVSAMRNIDFNLGFEINRELFGDYIMRFTEYKVVPIIRGFMGVQIYVPIESIESMTIHKITYQDSQYSDEEMEYKKFWDIKPSVISKAQKKKFVTVAIFQTGHVLISGVDAKYQQPVYEWLINLIYSIKKLIEVTRNEPQSFSEFIDFDSFKSFANFILGENMNKHYFILSFLNGDIKMEEVYRNIITQICVPFALKMRTVPQPLLYSVLDHNSSLDIVDPPNEIELANIEGKTCALDSVLIALFSHYNLPMVQYSKAQIKIANWINTIENKHSIQSLLPLLKKFPHEEKFHLLSHKDAIEFLIYIVNGIFSDIITSVKIFKTIDDGVLTTTRIDRSSSPIQYIHNDILLQNGDGVVLRDYLTLPTKINNTRTTTEELVESDMVIFAVDRVTKNGHFLSIPVTPTLSLTTPNGDRFFLGSVVVATPGHYSCCVRNHHTWTLHDGPNEEEINIQSDYIKKFGVIYIYFSHCSSISEHYLSHWNTNEELMIGVFEDEVTNKIKSLSELFRVVVSDKLPMIKELLRKPAKFEGEESGDDEDDYVLKILPVRSYLRKLKL